jgi:thiol-disulfide isomerase/thioredoxin
LQGQSRIPVPLVGRSVHYFLLIIFVSLCLLNSAQAQSRDNLGAAEGRDLQFSVRYNFQLDSLVQTIPNESGTQRLARHHSRIDLERFPLLKYSLAAPDVLPRVEVGQNIDERILDLPLRIVSGTGAVDTVTIRSYSIGRILVLDFWAGFCAPCVRSIDHWEEIYPDVAHSIKVLGVHIDYDYKVLTEAAKREWRLPHVIGKGTAILTHYFFGTPTVGPMVWIKDGRLWQITRPSDMDDLYILDIADGRKDTFPDSVLWKNNNSLLN